jgi:hypothetical protein
MLTLKTYAHSMPGEETDLSFANFSTGSSPKRPYMAPLLNESPDSKNAPGLAAEGVPVIWSMRPEERVR